LFFWIEAFLALLGLLAALFVSGKKWPWATPVESAFRRVAERRVLAVFLVGVLSLAARIAILPIKPVPYPSINDEFSFLLAADTFAHGRLANPPHPMWIHFENLHELQQPTYASMYPPAQGVFLAIGQRIFGHPFAGVCLVVALFCAATCWMLQGWTSPSLALLGGLLAIIRFGMFSYWANSYWGGAAAALGGALVVGAVPRIRSTQKPLAAITMGAGLAILANSRPYEGMILSIPVAVWLLRWILQQKGRALRRALIRIAFPVSAILLITALSMGYYFWRVTGNPLLMPQVLERKTYAVTPYFLWQSPRPVPVYNHPLLHDFYTGPELTFYRNNRSLPSFAALATVRAFEAWLFYLSPVLTVPLLLAAFARSARFSWKTIDPNTRFLLILVACFSFGLSIEVFFYPHYAAPIASVLWALAMRALGDVRTIVWRGKPSGLFLARSVPVVCLVLLTLRCAAVPLHLAITSNWPPTWYNGLPIPTNRPKVLSELNQLPGKHLVLVQYGKISPSRLQWVYNESNIDTAHIVWAWDMGSERNRELLAYFKDHQVWSLNPDRENAELSPECRRNDYPPNLPMRPLK
jgi:hypothetical protein